MEIKDINNLPELTKYSNLFRASYDQMFKIYLMTDMSSVIAQILLKEKASHMVLYNKLNHTLIDIINNMSKSLSIANTFMSLDRIQLFSEIINNYDKHNILLITSRLKIIGLYLTNNIKHRFSAILSPLLYKKDTWEYQKNYNILKSSDKVISLIGDYETSHIDLLNLEETKFYNNELGLYEYVFCPTIFYNQRYAFGQLIYPAFVYILTNIVLGMLNLKNRGALIFELKNTPVFPALNQLFYILESCFENIEYNHLETSVLIQCNNFNRTLFSTKYATMLIQACKDAQEYQIDNLYELDDIDIIYSKNIKPRRKLSVVHKLFDNDWKSSTVHILETKFLNYFVKLNTLATQLLPIEDTILYHYLNTFLLNKIMETVDFMEKNKMVFSKYYYTLLFNYHNDIFTELYKSSEPIIINANSTTSLSSNTINTVYNLAYTDSLINNLNYLIAQLPADNQIISVFDNIRNKNIVTMPEYITLKTNPNPEIFELIYLIYKKNINNILHIGTQSGDVINTIQLINKDKILQKWRVIVPSELLKNENTGMDFKLFYKYPENYLTGNITKEGKYNNYVEKLTGFNPQLITCFTNTYKNYQPSYDWLWLCIIMNIAIKKKQTVYYNLNYVKIVYRIYYV